MCWARQARQVLTCVANCTLVTESCVVAVIAPLQQTMCHDYQLVRYRGHDQECDAEHYALSSTAYCLLVSVTPPKRFVPKIGCMTINQKQYTLKACHRSTKKPLAQNTVDLKCLKALQVLAVVGSVDPQGRQTKLSLSLHRCLIAQATAVMLSIEKPVNSL